MHGSIDTEEFTASRLHARTHTDLHAAMAVLNHAISLLDGLGGGNTGLSLAAAHAETAIHLIEAELAPAEIA